MTLLIDIAQLTERQTETALGAIYKAINGHGDDDSIWNPHDSPYVRRIIELFTQRGLTRLDKVRGELTAWAEGERHRAGDQIPRPMGYMRRWDAGELSLVQLYLETLPPGQFTLDDWGMVVDYLVQRYLPEGELRTEAEWLATKSGLMGKVQANLDKPVSERQADNLLAALPNNMGESDAVFKLSPAQRAVLDFGRVRAAESVTRLADNVRHKMRDVIMRHEEERMLAGGAAAPGSALRTRLVDEFSTLNKDWRRIAVTEAGETANQGFVASCAPGSHVKRVEQYLHACPHCRQIDGVVVEVVEASRADKDPDTMIWPGKNNVGRSASPRKRVGGALVERDAGERWTIAAGVQHPHCRGTWLPDMEFQPGDDPDFAKWLKATLGKKK